MLTFDTFSVGRTVAITASQELTVKGQAWTAL